MEPSAWPHNVIRRSDPSDGVHEEGLARHGGGTSRGRSDQGGPGPVEAPRQLQRIMRNWGSGTTEPQWAVKMVNHGLTPIPMVSCDVRNGQ